MRTLDRQRQAPLWASALATVALSLVACPATTPAAEADQQTWARAQALVRGGTPRAAVAVLLAEAVELRDRAPARGGRLLARAFSLRQHLLDDRALRDLLAAWPAEHLPPALRPARAFEEAQRRFATGDPRGAARALRGTADAARAASDPVTAARADLLTALVAAADTAGTAERREDGRVVSALLRVTRAPIEGLLGASLKSLAWLTLGSVHYDARRMGRAIRAYLRVGRRTGRWRLARVAMAWCQFRLQRPERAHAILAQLPGGAASTPESALLDALSLHALGQLVEARAVLDAARDRAQRWDARRLTPEAVLAAAAAAEHPHLDAPPRVTLASLVAQQQPVWSLAREVLATDRLQSRAPPAAQGAVARYRQLVWAAFAQASRASAQDLVRRATRGLDDLTTLRPQIRPLTPAPPSDHDGRR